MTEAKHGSKYVDETTEITDVEAVIASMLTENTGRHFLDSGSAYGRHHEENREQHPRDKPRNQVHKGYVTRNVFHHLTEYLRRDDECTRLERQLYELGERQERDSWLTCMEDFAERKNNRDRYGNDRPPQTFNSYNSEFGSLSQCIQVVGFGYGGENYVLVQVHGGCDIRGGYTKPRVFRGSWREVLPMEFQFYCPECEWSQLESCLDWDLAKEMTDPEANTVACPECDCSDIRV